MRVYLLWSGQPYSADTELHGVFCTAQSAIAARERVCEKLMAEHSSDFHSVDELKKAWNFTIATHEVET